MTAADRLATLCWRYGYDLTCWVEGQSDGPTTTATHPRWHIEVIRSTPRAVTSPAIRRPRAGIGRYGATLDEAARLMLAALEVTP